MLNCETCALTQHHCCKASIAFNIMEVIDLLTKAENLGIAAKVRLSPEKQNYFNLVEKSKPIKSLNDTNCIFLSNGRCLIYNERPSVCKVYGSELVKCWFYDFDYDTPIDTMFNMGANEVEKLTADTIARNEKSVIEFFGKKMK